MRLSLEHRHDPQVSVPKCLAAEAPTFRSPASASSSGSRAEPDRHAISVELPVRRRSRG
ncbi:hypothetical protein ACQP1K_13865 [Sphaerimonospora sp. CA-214678]|uniref:hypothetical protein n=1 Tax=Sphaerimonospora sp. CA-214678 TaxID=3240029 RepID=UPI003D8DB102